MNRIILLVCCLFLVSCSFVATLIGSPQGEDYQPATTVTAEQIAAVEQVEARIAAATVRFGEPFKTRPRLNVIRTADQIITAKTSFLKGIAWKDVPSKFLRAAEPRVESEGYSGLWLPPDIFVSVIGDRAGKFKQLYAHERAHSFFTQGSGHNEQFFEVEKFLLQ